MRLKLCPECYTDTVDKRLSSLGLFFNFHSMSLKTRTGSRNVEKSVETMLELTVKFHYVDKKTNANKNRATNMQCTTCTHNVPYAHTTIDFVCFPFFLFRFGFHSHWLFVNALHNKTICQTICIEHGENVSQCFKKKKSKNVEWKQKRAKKLFLRCTNSVRCCTQSAQLLFLSPSLRYLCASHSLIISLVLLPCVLCILCCVVLCAVLQFNCSQPTNKCRKWKKCKRIELSNFQTKIK